jgi:alkylation response protein AidB-like acyl-CoA dehydrogenase
MDFTFSEEQEQLRAAARSWLERGPGADGGWDELVELGWTDLPTLVDMVPVVEEMGRAMYAGPFLSSGVFATLAARRIGFDAGGRGRGTIALDELGHGDPVERVRTRAVRRAGRWYLSGLKPFVVDGDSADWALVAARTPHGLGTFLVESPTGEVVPAWDQRRTLTRVALDDRLAEPVGPDGDHTALWRRIADDCAVALCAELIGVMEQANHLAVEYAKARVQFDRPIATFQVIKHKAADMLHRLELSRVGAHYAAWASDAEASDREEAAAMAKGYVAESAVAVTGECIQIHGGVGFTWDCEAHLLYRRAKQSDLLLGYSGWQRQRLADLVLS